MSFGVGIGDVVLVTNLAWKLYKSCKESSEDFRRISNELALLHIALGETQDYLNEHNGQLADSRRNRYQILLDNCKVPLEDLNALLGRYDSLNTQSQRTWDRMRFGLKDLAEIRQRFVEITTQLSCFNTMLINSCTTRIEKKLTKFIQEVQAGMREGSVVTVPDVELSEHDAWIQLRRELEDIGISAATVEENHDYILGWFKDALANDLLEERADVVEGASICITPTRETEQDNDAARGDSGYFSADGGITAMNAASDAFEADVQRARRERNVAEVLDPLSASTSFNLSPPPFSSDIRIPLVRKRRSTALGLVRRMLKKDTAIVQAASDGDIDRVARLLSLGMDVNARDRWGWSALSMCGYGGHKAIARLLLDHGADMDNIDVDGDTPKGLAEQRGHTDVVLLFEEERAARDLKARESDREVPRP
ncbi:hypothetical protein GGX14DRAFT_646912 [Mycena pura]|uniref:Fungal N-terminal domain-containing protein n=1 Tax=Mycena pura TaxID=153505 RepID=A0AAD6V714_9AGAR|nr:hypothetical protein GGX14DRAFT_646912 [Mycena pura]